MTDAELRRVLGPTAWTVLEELAAAADRDVPRLVVRSTNVRDLAARLALNKDTVAAALARLIATGVVIRRPQERVAGCRFGAVAYELVLPASAVIDRRIVDASVDPSRSSAAPRDKSPSTAAPITQSHLPGAVSPTPPTRRASSPTRTRARPQPRVTAPSDQLDLFAPSDLP